ncbi:MAG: hypothetical protein RIS85_1199, partial [Pseudomonadota bacterium]
MPAEWLIENGIAETRAILVSDDEILAARVDWAEHVRPGLVAQAQLIARPAGTRRGTVRLESGHEALIEHLPPSATEGSRITVRITRAAIAEKGRTKLPVARPAPGESPHPAPTLAESLATTDFPVRILPATDNAFARHGWDDLVEQALSGEVAFNG